LHGDLSLLCCVIVCVCERERERGGGGDVLLLCVGMREVGWVVDDGEGAVGESVLDGDLSLLCCV
jgi:hypothetical protein